MGDNDQIDIYRFNTKAKIDKQKIFIIIIIIIALICAIIIKNNINKTIKEYKVYKQYESQLQALEQQKIEKEKIKEEQEKKAEEERLAKLPKLTDEGRKNIENIYKSETKRAFLTFDDGPSSVTPRILDILKEKNVKATFFVLGSMVESRPEMVKRIYEEGHFIASHGYSHVYSQIYSSPQAVLDEYNLSMEKIRQALGINEYNAHLFRYPGGLPGGKYADVKKQAKDLLSQNEIVTVDWNCLSGDAETNDLSVEFELQRINETSENKNSIVVLMHDAPAKSVTADSLLQIIDLLKEKGYEFKNFYEIIK